MNALSETHWQPDEAHQLHHAALKAAAERCKEYARLYTRCGRVAHLSPPWGHRGHVLCPVEVTCPCEWRGTGSQAEYDLAAELETCSRCRRAFMDSQRCGNPECPCQKWGALPAGGDAG